MQTSISLASSTPAARAGAASRQLWKQVCVRARLELNASTSAAVRELLLPGGPSASPPPAADLQRAARLLAAAGIALGAPAACASGPVRLAEGSTAQQLALVVDAVASDSPVISTWKPPAAPAPAGTSVVLAQAGLVGSRPAAAPLLEACTMWAERLALSADNCVAEPFEVAVLGWPLAAGSDRVCERYLAGGPGSREHGLQRQQERQSALLASRQVTRTGCGAFDPGTPGQQALSAFVAHRASVAADHGLPPAGELAPQLERLAA